MEDKTVPRRGLLRVFSIFPSLIERVVVGLHSPFKWMSIPETLEPNIDRHSSRI